MGTAPLKATESRNNMLLRQEARKVQVAAEDHNTQYGYSAVEQALVAVALRGDRGS